MKLLQKY